MSHEGGHDLHCGLISYLEEKVNSLSVYLCLSLSGREEEKKGDREKREDWIGSWLGIGPKTSEGYSRNHGPMQLSASLYTMCLA